MDGQSLLNYNIRNGVYIDDHISQGISDQFPELNKPSPAGFPKEEAYSKIACGIYRIDGNSRDTEDIRAKQEEVMFRNLPLDSDFSTITVEQPYKHIVSNNLSLDGKKSRDAVFSHMYAHLTEYASKKFEKSDYGYDEYYLITGTAFTIGSCDLLGTPGCKAEHYIQAGTKSEYHYDNAGIVKKPHMTTNEFKVACNKANGFVQNGECKVTDNTLY